jgi:prepilin-type processing-associated H-X9-DG protein
MSLSINGASELDPNSWYLPSFKKFTQIRNPDPAKLFAFLDVQEDEIWDATFGMPNSEFFPGWQVWWDIPSSRHSQGGNLSFADGHVEHWKWRVPRPSQTKNYPISSGCRMRICSTGRDLSGGWISGPSFPACAAGDRRQFFTRI